jgi:hypothetical protein
VVVVVVVVVEVVVVVGGGSKFPSVTRTTSPGNTVAPTDGD